ncbi:C13 family peptidase, partial [Methanoregula sp.]|uniref:C13 family peptidase n=1 Tax=Methanoregula sp. TaxID=2052170 RepID=UPI000CBD80BA
VYQVVQGEATVTGWNETGVRTALTDIRTGAMPWITGASGGLEYDVVLGVDPIITWYSHWTVDNGTFKTLKTISSENLTAGSKSDQVSAGGTRASEALMSITHSDPYSAARERTAFRAVIVGPSQGWRNYRHQSDALSVYTLLRKNGVSDEDIILMTFDDVPTTPENPLKGDVHNVPRGENLRVGALVDYTGPAVTADTLKNVLTGNRTASTPVVLESNAGTDVFVYIASHGSPGEVVFAYGHGFFTTDDFTTVTDAMARDGRYRQMVFFVDTCFGESIATGATAPGIYYLTGAAKNEPSLGAVYDMDIKQWLSDEFTSSVLSTLRANPEITFRELYPATYKTVTGSHVRMVDTGQFDLDTPVMAYLSP